MPFPSRGRGWRIPLNPFIAFFVVLALSTRAMLQFDVFPGYDGVVPEASWFPIICEVKNDGPGFNGTIEISAGQFNEGQTRRTTVELPTGTLKRIEIPVFSTARYQSTWDVRLVDERGRVRAEQLNLRPTHQLAASTTLVGALPRTATGVPALRPTRNQDSDMQPRAARLQSALVPDNPLAFEGMDSIYLNSERASELNDHQIFALMAWLNAGGHLIVGIEQITDVNAVPWLRKIVPCDLTDMKTVSAHTELQEWLRGNASAAPEPASKTKRPRFPVKSRSANYNPYSDVAEDPDFEKADLQVAIGNLRDATVLASASGTPLLISSHEGRGRVTAIMFSPERKPFSTWKNAPSFWAKLTEVSPELYVNDNNSNNYNYMRGGWSIDGVFGAMIDSKQVRKLPVEWLLLLLIVYLVVIGPLDQYWLKRIKRPMLTWITFPCYVVLFSLLIYFIGYKLRAGETEWNELHFVDVLMNGDSAEFRGRTYASIYSPINATYRVEAQERFSSFRGEFASSWNGGGQTGERAEVMQIGDNFKADIFVPVWTSQLYVSDWWQSAPVPVKLTVTSDGGNWAVTVANLRDHPLTNAHVAISGRILELGDIAARQTKTFKLAKEQGMTLSEFVTAHASGFQQASTSRQQAFGASGGGHIGDLPNSTMAVSFISNLQQERFICPPGLDLTPLVDRGNAVLLAWESDYTPIKPLNRFPSRRGRTDTLWRIVVPVNSGSGS